MKKERMRILLLVGVLASSMMLTSSLSAFEQDEPITIALQEKNITLYSPFEIISTMMFRDGGTIAIVIEDSAGISLPFCLDGRIQRPSPLRRLYIGATYPSDAEAEQVPIGSAAEKAMLSILKSATTREPGPQARADLVEHVIEKLENRTSKLLK
jgi:hypothetical protein